MTSEDKANYVTEGIAIAAFTLFSYIMAFEYESGYCSHWQIPTYFIDISLTTVVAAGLGLFSFLLWTFFIVNIPISFFDKEISKEDSLRRRVVIAHLVALFILIAVWQGFGFSFVTIVLTTTFLILDVILLLVPWYLDKRKHSEKADFFKRITRAQEGNEEPKTGYYWFRIIMGAKLYWLVLCILPIMMLLAVAAGSAYAKKQQNFLVVESEGLILIKRYGESYILRTIDLSKNNVSGEIVIWRSEDIAKHKLSPKVIKNIEIAI